MMMAPGHTSRPNVAPTACAMETATNPGADVSASTVNGLLFTEIAVRPNRAYQARYAPIGIRSHAASRLRSGRRSS